MAMILVTHDLGVVATRTDEIIVMYAGNVVERAPTNVLFAHGHALHRGAPQVDAPHRRAEPHPPDRRSRAGRRTCVEPAVGMPLLAALPLRARRSATWRRRRSWRRQPDHRYACWYPLTAGDPASQPSPRPDPVQV